MSNLDLKRRDALDLAESLGYRWTGSTWELPHIEDLPAERQLSTMEIADLMCRELISMMPADPESEMALRLQWLHEAWDSATGFNARHLPNRGKKPD